MEYTEFTKDQQTQLLKSRIASWEADHFSHELNLTAFEAISDTQGIETSKEAMGILESSIAVAREKLDSSE